MVWISLLGGVRVATDDGGPVDIGSTKSQTVLAALALSPGTALAQSRLIELVWGDAPPRTAHKTLQWHVAQLRRSLGAAAIVRVGAAYRLDVPPDAVDVARFQRHLRDGDVGGALAQWGGEPLAGLDAPGLAAAVAGLTEQWLGAVETDLERRTESDPRGVLGELSELVAHHPLRESLWSLLMTALYRVGRQADALAAYQRARQHLVTHLGVEPGPALRELESMILDHDERLHAPAAPAHAPMPPAPASAPVPPQPAPPPRPSGTVTFGWAQVAHPLAHQVAHPADWATHRTASAATARLDQLVRAAADGHGGHVFAATATAAASAAGADVVAVAFHRAEDAAAWAARLQRSALGEPWPDGTEPGVRIGLHTGESEEVAGTYTGAAVYLAARICAAGHAGQILTSGATAGLLARSDLHDLGWFRLDGVLGDQRIVQLGDGEHPPIRLPGSRRGSLPGRGVRLIGRDADLRAVADALAGSPVVTLVGPGGIGKTQLALASARAVAADHGWDAWLVELAGITTSSDVPRAVADALAVAHRPGHTLTQSVVAALRARPALLLLDNCEHVMAGAADLTQAVVGGCPLVRVLATSRERLAVTDEQVLALQPLDPAAGAELFHARALAADRTYDAGAHHHHVEEICRRLDGIPLAIELAAARTVSHRPVDLVARLDDRLRATGSRRTGAARHRTMRSAIHWSYDLLTPGERTLFQRLSVVNGPFDLAAAEALGHGHDGHDVDRHDVDGHDADALLGDLVERSMVTADTGPFGRRFRLLETMREFAAEQLRASGDADLAAERHAGWCVREVTRVHGLLTGPGEIEGVARLAELLGNLRAAVTWACATGDPRLADALVRPLVTELPLRGRQEVGGWAEQILAATSADEEDLRAFWLVWVAVRYTQNANPAGYREVAQRYGAPGRPLGRYADAYADGDGEALSQCLPDAVADLHRQGEQYLAAFVEMNSAGTLLGGGRFQEVDTSVTALADRYRVHGPPTLLHWALQTLGYSASFQGRHDHADQCFDEAAGVELPAGTLSANKTTEARSAFRRGERLRAFQLLHSHIDELLDSDNVIAASVVSVEFVNMMAAIDRVAEAAHMLGYLRTSNEFGAMAARTLVTAAAAADTIAAAGPDAPPAVSHIDDRAALLFMRDVLADLVLSGSPR